MNRIITGVLLSVALAGMAAAAPHAATGVKVASAAASAPAAPAPDHAAQCKNLGSQWKTVAETHKTDKKFAQAQSDAMKAERNCATAKSSAQKKGVSQYEDALKLLGVTPTP